MNLSDNTRNYIADRINNLHLALCCYSSIGWLSEYHSKILVFLLPSMMFNWLIDNNECWITRLENYFRIQSDNRDLNYSKYYSEGENYGQIYEEYNSSNTKRLNENQLINL